MLASFANTFKVPELRSRILLTIGLIFISRLISMIPTPGVDWQALQQQVQAIRETAGSAGGLMGLFDVFTGGAMSRCSVGFLSIWPYISASIIIQLMTAVVPTLERLSREGDTGRQQITQYTRYLTIGICVFQSFGIAKLMMNPQMMGFGTNVQFVAIPGVSFVLMTMLCMTTASLLVMWLGDQITQRGIGNGVSLIIMINIVSRLPAATIELVQRYFGMAGAEATHNKFELALLLLLGLGVILFTVALTQGVRKVPIHSTRRVAGNNVYGGGNTFFPMRVNFTGVMPIIFAGPLIQFPAAGLARIPWDGGFWDVLRTIGVELSNTTSIWHLLLYSALILFFSFFWVATQFNAMQISDNLKRDGSYVPGIRPGMATAEYLDMVMTRVTLIGGLGLLIVAILPQVLQAALKLPWEMSSFFGGTSLLIIVGVALDTLRQMESHLLMRNYDGFLKHGRLRARSR